MRFFLNSSSSFQKKLIVASRADEDLNEIPGIPKKDLLAFESYAKDQNVVLLIRPVEPLTKILHESGNYPSKNFTIKGKSSSWGLWAGFIPIDQQFSKLIGQREKIKQSNEAINDCIKKGHAQKTHLKIPQHYFKELINKEIIFPPKKNGRRLSCYLLSSPSF
jgi:hypothetical protein